MKKVVTAQQFFMKHYLFFLLLAAIVIIPGACKKEKELADPESANSVSEASSKNESSEKKRHVNFKAYFETNSVVLAPPPILKLKSTGTGIASHMGKATLEAYPTVNLTTAPPFAVSGTLTITAANGDELHASFTGTRSAPDATGAFIINATYTITGGTGRFENASGSFEGVSTGIVGSPAGTARYHGHIYFNCSPS